MPLIPEDVLEQIRLRADIVEVVQSYVPTLKKMGMTWKACCPFHHEKTPSFTVNAGRQIFKCFGCGKGGNVFNFVMEMEQLGFADAAELLAKRFGVYIPDPVPGQFAGKKKESFPGQVIYGSRERLCTLHEKIAEFYRRNLLEHPDSPVAAYFKTRGLPDDIAARFMIGAAPDAWDSAIQFAHKNGFIDDELRTSGIVSSKEDGSNHIYDRFRNRLVFPIWNEQGRIVGFSARSIEKDPKGWKYVNSPESPIFRKGRLLYALNFARTAIPKANAVILCEGQLDTIAWHRAGLTHAVAPQGTAFTAEQAMILKRHTQNVVLALDNDSAGHEAVFKDAAILLPLGFNLKVALYQGAKDADETLAKFGSEALEKTAAEAVDFFEFALTCASQKYDVSVPSGKSAAANDVVRWILQLDNEITRDFYIDWLANKLSVSIDSIRSVVQRRSLEGDRFQAQLVRQEATPVPALKKPDKSMDKALAVLLQLVCCSKEFAEAASRDLPPGSLGSSPVAKSVEYMIQTAMNDEWDGKCDGIFNRLNQTGEDVSELAELLSAPLMPLGCAGQDGQPASPQENTPEYEAWLASLDDFRRSSYNSCLRSILNHYLMQERARLIDKAKNPDVPQEERNAAVLRITGISKELLSLSDKYPVK